MITISKTRINGREKGPVLIGPTEEGTENFVPQFYTLVTRNVLGAVPTISVGTNKPEFNNLINSLSLGKVPSDELAVTNVFTEPIPVIVAGTGIFVNVESESNDEFEFDFYLHGIYVAAHPVDSKPGVEAL